MVVSTCNGGDGRRDVLEVRADERQAGFALPDGGPALAFEHGIDHGELPAWGGPLRPDAVLAGIEADVLHHIAGFVDAR